MILPPALSPEAEARRLAVLAEYQLLNSDQNEDLDRLTQLASRLFHTPIVLISLVDRDRQLFKSRVGLDVCETIRDISFCAHAIVADDIFVVSDALADPRFRENPLVLGRPFIRFYAGKPLVTPSGERLGTLCLIDDEPRDTFTPVDRANLTDIASLVMDRLEMRRLNHMRSISQARFENIAATSPDAIICSNTRGHITFWNHAAERLFGYSAAEVDGTPLDLIVPDSWRRIYDDELSRLKNGDQPRLAGQTIELSGLRRDGSEFPAELSLSAWRESDSISVGAIIRDITDRKQHESRLFSLASLDALTGLPNRAAWRGRLDHMLGDAQPATVLLLDLDGFKEVNDTLGHSAGDHALIEVASRLRNTCPDAVKLARLGGDEFVALLKGDDPEVARRTAASLVASLARPFEFAGQILDLSASIGVSISPQHSTVPDELLGAADLALYRAKAAGKGRYELFSPMFREVAVARRAFARELRIAFENGEFEIFYQAQVDTVTRRVTGAEALMRWRHPQRGLLSPASFIDVLSEKPSAPAIGEWALRQACEAAASWGLYCPNFHIGVNLFSAQLRSGQLVATIERVLSDTGLPAASLELELVENILLRSDDTTFNTLRALRDMGVGLAFDDYGTGYASLSLLKRLPVTRLKIDRSFIRNVIQDQGDAAVVNAILYLGRSFGLHLIAEGVETEAQLAYLAEHGCGEVQGYLFGHPLPREAFAATHVVGKAP